MNTLPTFHTVLPPDAQAKLRSAAATVNSSDEPMARAIAIDRAAAEIRTAVPHRFRQYDETLEHRPPLR